MQARTQKITQAISITLAAGLIAAGLVVAGCSTTGAIANIPTAGATLEHF
jgi:outer membrane murein-binding lipoprotein Lpp